MGGALPGPKITMTKAPDDYNKWELTIDAAAADRADVWVDLNNNGLKDDGEAVSRFGAESADINVFPLGSSKEIVLYGKVTKLGCSNNELTALSFYEQTGLKELDCSGNRLRVLKLSALPMLEKLDCGFNELTALDITENVALKSLECLYNELTTLFLSNNKALTYLECMTNKLTALDLSQNTALETLSCSDNAMTTLAISGNKSLTTLYCMSNKLSVLDISNNIALTTLACAHNQLTSLNFSNNPAINNVDISRNLISGGNMQAFLNSLPIRSSANKGTLHVLMYPDGNSRPANADILSAKSKHWELYEFNSAGEKFKL